ncbi:MAG TPA: cell division protein FtsZ [Rickettsia endosymbiont of Pyrocoelia pectoralis]|nr:cell division protein FtsZ [Rickettsia endosymbiont of Pyrocoelia pectoralis]
MVLNIKAPENIVLKPIITVFGVGGAGSNAVNNMIAANLQGANFVVANTDAQSLEHSNCTNKIQLGVSTTRGLGAGASPEVGSLAAQESESEIRSYLENSNMVFITAGMGGGTGTGASPVIARIAKELGLLTVGVVTKPFDFEGKHRMRTADRGLIELQQFVDTLIVIPNQNLFRIANEQTTFADAFKMADDVLHAGVRSVTDLIIMPGLINLDFADIRAIMSEMGKAMMGTGEASGEDRAIKAAESAISNPLLDHSSMHGARGVLINITGGHDMTLFEVDSAANKIREEVNNTDANIIFGSTFNPDLKGIVRVSVVATGIDADKIPVYKPASVEVTDIPTYEQENLGSLSGSAQIEEIPDFNSYNSEEAEITDSLNPNFNISEDNEELHVNTHNNLTEEKTKPSFFGRMWGSFKSSNNQTPERKNVVVGLPEQDTSESDIHDIPAFLRKKKD